MFKEELIKQQFYPTALGLLTNPFYFARRGLLAHIRLYAPKLSGRVLDVGCGDKPYEKLFTGARQYIGLELDSPHNRLVKTADAFYNGRHFPFADAEFDGVFASQVLEHVFNPEEWLREISRVMKSGGSLLLTVPFVWDEHEQPHDFGRYSSFGLKALLERKGFAVTQQKKSVNDITAVIQLIILYIYKKTASWRRRHFDLLVTLIFIAPWNILGLALTLILPVNNDLYLDNIILAKKV